MKTLLIALITLLLVSKKKKKNSTCYKCQIVENGVPHEEIKCGNADGHYTDAQGNDLNCIQIH